MKHPGHTKYISKQIRTTMGRKVYSVQCEECEFVGTWHGDRPSADLFWARHLTWWDKEQHMMLDESYLR